MCCNRDKQTGMETDEVELGKFVKKIISLGCDEGIITPLCVIISSILFSLFSARE